MEVYLIYLRPRLLLQLPWTLHGSTPQPLLNQLAVGGRLILPVGQFFQTLELYRRTAEGYEHKTLTRVRFVPLVRQGEEEE